MSRVRITPAWLAAVAGGRVRSGRGDVELGAVVTDSRALAARDVFVALRGPRFDGHGFVAEAFRRGALAAVVERDVALTGLTEGQGAIVEVSDTLTALQGIARAVRREAGTTVIAITGSVGKTTTKEAIAECLATRLRVVRNKGNLNNHIGLPLSLMDLRSGPDVAVMELGMNHAGEISTLVSIAEPNVRVWINVGEAHVGFFTSPDAIADAKAEILEGADDTGILVCNADDTRVMSRIGRFPGRVLTFGMAASAGVRATTVEDLGLDGMRAHVSAPGGDIVLETPLLGRGNVANLLAATAVATHFGVPLDEVAAVARRLTPAGRRGVVRRLSHGVTLIDDSYNSSPSALRVALATLAAVTGGRKVAVLGEMLELGEHSRALHEESGRLAAAAGVSRLVTVGGMAARVMADAAVTAGIASEHVSHFDTSQLAADVVVQEVRDGDIVLVKGSRGIATDLIADRLAAGLG